MHCAKSTTFSVSPTRQPHTPLVSERSRLLHKLVVDRLVHIQPAAGRAALPVVEEQRKVRVRCGLVHVHIRAHDDGALASQLQAAGLDLFGGDLADDFADLCAACEGNLCKRACGKLHQQVLSAAGLDLLGGDLANDLADLCAACESDLCARREACV